MIVLPRAGVIIRPSKPLLLANGMTDRIFFNSFISDLIIGRAGDLLNLKPWFFILLIEGLPFQSLIVLNLVIANSGVGVACCKRIAFSPWEKYPALGGFGHVLSHVIKSIIIIIIISWLLLLPANRRLRPPPSFAFGTACLFYLGLVTAGARDRTSFNKALQLGLWETILCLWKHRGQRVLTRPILVQIRGELRVLSSDIPPGLRR